MASVCVCVFVCVRACACVCTLLTSNIYLLGNGPFVPSFLKNGAKCCSMSPLSTSLHRMDFSENNTIVMVSEENVRYVYN